MYLVRGLATDELRAEQWDSCCAKKMQEKSGDMFFHTEEKKHRNTSHGSIWLSLYCIWLNMLYTVTTLNYPVVFAPHDALSKVKIKG